MSISSAVRPKLHILVEVSIDHLLRMRAVPPVDQRPIDYSPQGKLGEISAKMVSHGRPNMQQSDDRYSLRAKGGRAAHFRQMEALYW